MGYGNSKFISEVNDWDDVESIDKLIDEYDSKYKNWNHDFPIWGFRSILQDGLVMVPQISRFRKFLREHIDCSCVVKVEMIIQYLHKYHLIKQNGLLRVPDIFKNEKYLSQNIDLEVKKIEFYLHYSQK